MAKPIKSFLFGCRIFSFSSKRNCNRKSMSWAIPHKKTKKMGINRKMNEPCCFNLGLNIWNFEQLKWKAKTQCIVTWLFHKTAIPDNREFQKWKLSFFRQRHTLSTSFNIFVITYRVTNFLPKLIDMQLFSTEKNWISIFGFPLFSGYAPKTQWVLVYTCQKVLVNDTLIIHDTGTNEGMTSINIVEKLSILAHYNPIKDVYWDDRALIYAQTIHFVSLPGIDYQLGWWSKGDVFNSLKTSAHTWWLG